MEQKDSQDGEEDGGGSNSHKKTTSRSDNVSAIFLFYPLFLSEAVSSSKGKDAISINGKP